MSYIKADDVLPRELIEQIQRYVDGRYIYIPRKPDSRRAWGQETAYKAELRQRNQKIRADYQRGSSLAQLCETYHLTEKSIRRILQEK